MKTLGLNQHEALGDHVICNGLNREIFKKYKDQGFDKFIVWTRKWLIPSISFMFRDLNEVEVVDMEDKEINSKFNINVYESINLSRGRDRLGAKNIDPNTVNWDQIFYAGHDISFQTRWSSFKCLRDTNREKALFEILNPENEPFIISHNTLNLINYSKIRTDLKHIRIDKGITDNAFDYLLLLEKAEEIHCCDSSFKHIVESYPEIGKALFYHNNPPRNINHYHTSQKSWIEL